MISLLLARVLQRLCLTIADSEAEQLPAAILALFTIKSVI